MITEIYAVANKVSCILFEDKEDAYKYCGKVATASNGLEVVTMRVLSKGCFESEKEANHEL